MRLLAHRAVRPLLLLLPFVAPLLAGCSSDSGRGHPVGGVDAGGGACVEGLHRCQGNQWTLCQGGVLVAGPTCAAGDVCSDALGCTACTPGGTGCMGDKIVQCDNQGHPTQTTTQDCSPSTCVTTAGAAMCAGPCDPAALAKSYTGCVYYATDLPQWGLPTPGFGVIAADQPFAIAVANPSTVTLDVYVERDDAKVGTPVQSAMVIHKQVPGGGLVVIPLPQREVDGFVSGNAMKRSRSMLTANAYRITTSRPSSVYQFNPQNNPGSYSNDASLLIPVNALDASYVVLGWPGAGGGVDAGGFHVDTDNRSFVTIVGTRAGTRLRVTPSTEVMAGDNVMALHKGQSYTFTLGEFETLNLDGADFKVGGATDFTGTRIEADAPVAVWSGVQCITINPPNRPMDAGSCCCDHLEEQLFPRSSLGHDYVAVHSESRSHAAADPEFFRVLALDDATDVKTTLAPPHDHFLLNQGAMHEIITSEDFTVTASKAVTVGQFQVSQDSSAAGQGDPSFELVPPVAQYRTRYIFLVPSGYGENWMLVSIPTAGDLTIDGKAETTCERSTAGLVGGTMYDALRCPLTEGAHTVSSMVGFGIVVEGWGPGPVSYGYTGGMEFNAVNHDCTNDSNCPSSEFCSGGACVPVIM